jgi:hypothetical protein
MDEKDALVSIKIEIEPEVLKRVIEEGRVSEFVATFPAVAAGYLKGHVVEYLATRQGATATLYFDGDEYGAGPWPGPGPRPFIEAMRLRDSTLRQIVG